MIPMLPQISQSAAMRRDDICIYVSPSNRARLVALIDDRKYALEGGVAGRDRAGDGRWTRHQRDHAAYGQVEAVRLALAGALYLMRDKTRPSRKPPLAEKIKLAVLTKTATETPANATHWSRASMAAEMGISPSSVGRIWAEAGLKPHLVKRSRYRTTRSSRRRSPMWSGST
jgi:hypothetical protein